MKLRVKKNHKKNKMFRRCSPAGSEVTKCACVWEGCLSGEDDHVNVHTHTQLICVTLLCAAVTSRGQELLHGPWNLSPASGLGSTRGSCSTPRDTQQIRL